MNEVSPATDSIAANSGPADMPGRSVRVPLGALAQRAIDACAGKACVIAWRGAAGHGVVRAPASARWRGALDTILASAERQLEHRPNALASVHLAAGPMARPVGANGTNDEPCQALARCAVNATNRVTIALAAPHGIRIGELDAILRLASDHAIGILNAGEAAASRGFWRARAMENAVRLRRAQAELTVNSAADRRHEAAVAAALKLKPRMRFAGLGAIFARLGPFDAWIVAAGGPNGLRAVAVSAAPAPIAPLEDGCALADSLRRNSIIVRTPASARAAVYPEDRIFAGFAAYACVPLDSAAVALAARQPIETATIASLEALATRVGPIVAGWLAQAEVEQLRRLVRNLGLRMFGAIDTERARIARDLHDHQAQLLAASRIALEAGPDEARGVLKQLEEALRLRVRELRPATLGRSTLADALRYEMRRLADAGIKVRLLHEQRMNALTRPVQQVCYQVAREALSNVIRHAEATRVEIGVEKLGDLVRLSIIDNGKGAGRAGNGGAEEVSRRGTGMGLTGLGERLEFMGGGFKIESRAGGTRFVAEIPEPG